MDVQTDTQQMDITKMIFFFEGDKNNIYWHIIKRGRRFLWVEILESYF